jgi:hypothetical protein
MNATASSQTLNINAVTTFPYGGIFLTEQADAIADVAGDGQIWVNTATPNELWFTTDAGDDIQLTSGTGIAAGIASADTEVLYDNSGVIDGDSTFTFNDTTKTVSATNLSLGGFLDAAEIAAPATPAADTLRLYVEDIQGFSFYKYLDAGGMKREVLRDSMILVYNNTGSQILANRVVYASGSFNDFPTVALAQSNSISTMPAIGVTIENINDTSYGRVMQVGLLENINTSALSVGDILYVHDTVAGLVRITAPLTPNLTQEIGTVLVDNATTGAIQIIARGLTGDEYGTAQNTFSIGDGIAGSKVLVFNAATATDAQIWVNTATPNELWFTNNAGDAIQLTSGTYSGGGSAIFTRVSIDSAATYIDTDGSNNMTFTDAVVGTKTLQELGSPTYKYIKATSQSEGDVHLSDGTNWNVSKALIKMVRVVTSSTDWDLYILQNDNGHVADDGNIPEMQIMAGANGNANIYLDLPYEDEDASNEVHFFFDDVAGSDTADIYVLGYGLI